MVPAKDRIRAAMLDLCQKKSYRDISVLELSKAAGVARSTFYAHYASPYFVLAEIEEEILSDTERHLKTIEDTVLSTGELGRAFVEAQRNRFAALEAIRTELNILNGPYGDPTFLSRRLLQGEEHNHAIVKALGISQNAEFISEIATHGSMLIGRYWLTENASRAPEAIADLLMTLVWQPILRYCDV